MSDFFEIFTLIVLFQLFFISLFLFGSRKGRALSNRLLGFFFMCMGAGLLDFYLLMTGFYDERSQYVFFLNSLSIMHAPLLLLYTQSLTDAGFRLRWIHLLHGIPFLLALALLFKYYYTQPAEDQLWIMEEVKKGAAFSTILISVIGLVYEFGYLLAVKLRIRKYRRQIREKFSNVDSINLNWLGFLVNLFIVSFAASSLSNFLRHTQAAFWKGWFIVFGLAGSFYFINSVLLKGLHQNKMFLGAAPAPLEGEYDTSAEKPLLDKLKRHLESQKPYLNPDLSLEQLANDLGASPRQLSTLINSALGKSFYDLINHYRIEEAKRVFDLSDDPKQTVLEVLYQVGFNSKSSFNTAFKKYTGITPTAYKGRNP